MSRVEDLESGRFWVAFRRRWRRICFLAFGLVIAVIVVGFACRWTCLRNLPDVGEPFDVHALESERVPDTENAFVLYREALGKLKSSRSRGLISELQAARRAQWTAPSPSIHAWVEENREATALWKRGAGRPDASLVGWTMDEVQTLNEFPILALLEAARLRREGDMAGAWGWYRAIHRTSRHYQQRGGFLIRAWGRDRLIFFRDEVLTWSTDRRVSPDLLRRAIDDVLATETLVVPNSDTLKWEYVALKRKLDDPIYLRHYTLTPDYHTTNWTPEEGWYHYLDGYEELKDFLRREPERSRRVARLIFTNWIAHADGIRPFRSKLTNAYPDLFMNQPATPAQSRIYPSGLSDWLVTTRLQNIGMPNYASHNQWREKEQAIIDTVILRLATEMYVRNHGQRPESDRDLIGPYLDRLPGGHPETEGP